ncbi:MAG: GAF domain-containing protein, partial [Acidobacteria bacterium]|nr:GAF domain-containing protein [Acidobacteriota bacterium]
MTDLNSRLDSVSRELETRLQAMRSINEFGRLMSLAREPEEITANLLDRMLSELHVACGSLLLVDANGDLVEVLRRGLAADPLTRRDDTGASPADGVLTARQPFIVRVEDLDDSQADGSPWLDELRALSLQSALAVPLVAQDRALGLITAYADGSRRPFEDAELELATALA